MLKDLLEKKQCFKLVCGAGNEDVEEIEKLVYIYSKAGCPFFDVNATPEIVDAAKRGLKMAGITKDRYLCVSVGIDGDPHITKATIDKNKCTNCGNCLTICQHNAIKFQNGNYEIQKERCLGCSQCEKVCIKNAIEMKSQFKEYSEILPPLIEKGIDCIEFHAISNDTKDIEEKWMQLNNLFNGFLCISVDRSAFGDKKLKSEIAKLLEKRMDYTTIIQADGVAMSGNNDEYATTLQAVATAQLFQNAKMPAYIMMSGGTNLKSTALAKQCGVMPHCLAVGSFARKTVKEYIELDNFFENEIAINSAINAAKNLIDISLESMKND